MGRMDAEWIIWSGKYLRSMWPHEVCEWAAGELGVTAPTEGSCVTWLALTLERSIDPDATGKRLLQAIADAPEGTFTEADQVAEQEAEARELDKSLTDRAEGHGRREGHWGQ